MFADDLAILAPTRGSMQRLIDLCESYCSEFLLTFNASKTKAMIFGKEHQTLRPTALTLNKEPIEIVSEWKYLGCSLHSGKEMLFSAKSDLSSFRRSANSIISSIRKPNEQVMMRLLYTYCVPILSYASEVKRYSSAEMHKCTVALNDCIRRIFSYNRWESVRTLREQLGYKDLTVTFAVRERNFLSGIPSMHNSAVSSLLHSVSH